MISILENLIKVLSKYCDIQNSYQNNIDGNGGYRMRSQYFFMSFEQESFLIEIDNILC